MPGIGYSLFILGVVVASAIADGESTTQYSDVSDVTGGSGLNISNDQMPSNITTSASPNTSSSLSTSKMSTTSMSMSPRTTREKGGGTTTKSPTTLLTTPTPRSPPESQTSTTKTAKTTKAATTSPKQKLVNEDDNAGIIILVVIILVTVGFGLACFLARRRGRRYSVDFASRPDEANIPLSTVEPVEPADAGSQNGLQTFQSQETSTKEPQEQAAEPEVQDEKKAETDKSVDDATAESAAPADSPDSSVSEDKPKADVVEQTPDAPVQQSVEEKTDDEGVASNQTSVESLKETNENNSNSTDLSQKRGLELSKVFWDVSLDSPV